MLEDAQRWIGRYRYTRHSNSVAPMIRWLRVLGLPERAFGLAMAVGSGAAIIYDLRRGRVAADIRRGLHSVEDLERSRPQALAILEVFNCTNDSELTRNSKNPFVTTDPTFEHQHPMLNIIICSNCPFREVVTDK
jgi:hypothetical protein